MPEIQAHGLSGVALVRNDDEWRTLTFHVECDDGTHLAVRVGRFFDDAENVVSALERAAKRARDDILEGWEDVLDFDADGVVTAYGGNYHVTLEGIPWGYSGFIRGNPCRTEPFPSQDIAEYELAKAMSESGIFPANWYVNERGNSHDIGESVRKYHDKGGTKLLPLEGVKYEDGADVLTGEEGNADAAFVVRDYGHLGIVIGFYGTGSPYRLVEHSEVREDKDAAK